MKNIILFSLVFLTVFSISGCSQNSGRTIPMKTYKGNHIPDGEFLHYGVYSGGDKNTDIYYVTRSYTNHSGDLYCNVYYNFIPVSKSGIQVGYYTNWPIAITIDPVRGQTVESSGNLNTNYFKDFGNIGVGGLVYWHYRLYREKGEVVYVSKSLNNSSAIVKTYKIKVNPDFPLLDMFSQDFITYRLIDPGSPGIIYFVMPDFMKDPLSMTVRLGKKDTLKVKAGTFKVNEVIMVAADGFIAKLPSPCLKTQATGSKIRTEGLLLKDRGLIRMSCLRKYQMLFLLNKAEAKRK